MANADNSDDVKHAITMGANAIGNCRTDAMLKEKQIDDVLRRANAEENPETRRSIIMEILPNSTNLWMWACTNCCCKAAQ